MGLGYTVLAQVGFRLYIRSWFRLGLGVYRGGSGWVWVILCWLRLGLVIPCWFGLGLDYTVLAQVRFGYTVLV